MKTIYLAGPIENSPDRGTKWREKYSKRLKRLGFSCINPIDEENKISGINDFNKLKKTDISTYINEMRKFIKADLEFVEKADIIICKWNGEISSGTNGEITYAYKLNKPCYLITQTELRYIPGWFLACFNGVFNNLEDLLEVLR